MTRCADSLDDHLMKQKKKFKHSSVGWPAGLVVREVLSSVTCVVRALLGRRGHGARDLGVFKASGDGGLGMDDGEPEGSELG